MCRSTVAGADVVKASDALTLLLGFGVTVTALTVRGAAAVVDAAAGAVLAADELSSDVHAAKANDAATSHVSTAARLRIGRTLRQPRRPIGAGREGPVA